MSRRAARTIKRSKGSWRLRSAAVRYVITGGDEMTTKGKASHRGPYISRRYPAHCYTCEYQVNADTMSNKNGVRVTGCLLNCEAPKTCQKWRDDQSTARKVKAALQGK